MAAMRHDIIFGHEKQLSVHMKDVNNKGSVVHSHYCTEMLPSNKKTDITANRKTSKLNDIKQEFSSPSQIMRDAKSVVKGQKAELKDKVVDPKSQNVAEIAKIYRRPQIIRDNRPKSARPDSRLERKRDAAGSDNFNQTNRYQNLHSSLRPKSARPDSRMLISNVENNDHLQNENSERLLDNIRMNGQRNIKYIENEPAKYPNNANVNPKSYAPTRYEQMDIKENENSNKVTRYQHISFHNEGQEKSSHGHTDIHNDGTIKLDQPAQTYLASQLNFEDNSRQQSCARNPNNVMAHERKVEPMDLTTEFHNEDLNIDPVEYFWRETESCSDYNCSYCRQKQQKALSMPQTKVHGSSESRSKGESFGGNYSNYTNKAKQFLETDIGFHRNRSSSLNIPRSQAYVNNVSNQQNVFSFRPRIKSDTEAQKSIVRDVYFDIEDPYASARPPSPPTKDKTFISSKNHKSRKQSLPFPSHPVYHKMSMKVMEKYRYIRPATFTKSVVAPSSEPAPAADLNQLKPRKLKPIKLPIQSKKK
ncbi:hypothetical protein CHS0354_025893 [Potamilus streckersoni]|uniref:Uncharacterized protein n=1 Tax=Potamilus streckersoni TaxID=2493646 RepID=A0AAE0TJ24_9BIVA|nr:hypothetical protein CHS0354_025893 [Potamilus streckersoni]